MAQPRVLVAGVQAGADAPWRRGSARGAAWRCRRRPPPACTTFAAYPPNSWPSVIGTASCRCVRPVFRIRANSTLFSSRPLARPLARREQIRHHRHDRQARRGRVHVVRGLPHVDVIVRVDARVLAARAAEDLRRAVGEDLVRVHVVRGAGARLIDVHDELVAQLPGEHVVGRADDRGRDRPVGSRPSAPLASAAAFLICTVAMMSSAAVRSGR